ncbi:AzlD domain-containing protein [Streptomyces vilmorinianum]|uniref:AzlD domain-containing protein n=1 Tax=Streptomyces vilmorinianum TaxID=3051092 RepID=UPI0010FB566E|nr:AzlD domain-containing protein [Streptomyces vilmorinianum]
MGTVLLIAGMALCAFAVRYLPLAVPRERELPGPLRSAVGYVPAAVLAAMVAPAVTGPSHGGAGLTTASLAGGLVTLVAGLATKRMLLAAALGVAAFFLVLHTVRG